jgi:hypothetical protein
MGWLAHKTVVINASSSSPSSSSDGDDDDPIWRDRKKVTLCLCDKHEKIFRTDHKIYVFMFI